MKKRMYGANRLLDADRSVKDQFIRKIGLDYGVRLRWYVEGDTEYYALESILGQFGAVELINLRGQVVASHGKGFSFRGDLRNDLKAKRYSFVSIDNDRSDNLSLHHVWRKTGNMWSDLDIKARFRVREFYLSRIRRNTSKYGVRH